jgi:signal transduction histidine kinase
LIISYLIIAHHFYLVNKQRAHMPRTHKKKQSDEFSILNNPTNGTLSKVITWIGNRTWWVIGLAIVLVFSLELYDSTHKLDNSVHIVEFSIFLVLLLIIGILLGSLMQGIRNQTRAIRILDAMHNLSLEFSGNQDWDVLVDQVVRFPGSIAPVCQAGLFIKNTINNQFDLVAQWSSAGAGQMELPAEADYRDFIRDGTSNDFKFGLIESGPTVAERSSQAKRYALPIKDKVRLVGVLLFTLEPGKDLTDEQADIFRNIGVDMAVALKAGQDRKILADLRNTETALAERRSVSHYLHDHLGQSLGFLHLKMDQLLTQKEDLSLEKVLDDLELMRDATYESYEIVRGILETIHPETTQTLTNLLMEHARKVSQRAGFQIDFKARGKPVLLPDETQQAVFYAFEELLSNVEKHARATWVKILAEWHPDYFSLSISDNGVGFNPEYINSDQHFGLEILSERMASVNGRITLDTTENAGTVVNILVPDAASGRLGAGA